jgi:hypothetical protein
MRAIYYRDLIVRAVLGSDPDPALVAKVVDPKTLDALANNLAEAESALDMLRHKGYGVPGMSVAATARLVAKVR